MKVPSNYKTPGKPKGKTKKRVPVRKAHRARSAPNKCLGQIWFEAVAPVAKRYWPEADNELWDEIPEADKRFLNDQAEAFLTAIKTQTQPVSVEMAVREVKRRGK